MKIIAPSILSADFCKLGTEIEAVEKAGADWIHADVMDGHFVPNITIGPFIVKAVSNITQLPIDVHLMIEDPDRYIPDFIKAGAGWISVHAEASVHLHRTIQLIKGSGVRAGVALNPATPLSSIECLLEELDYVVSTEVLNASDFGVPQNRERIFIIGFRKDLGIENFEYPKPTGKKKTFADIKEDTVVSVKYYLSDTYQNTLISHKQRHADKGNGFGYEIIKDNECANAIVVGGMGKERNIVIDCRLTDFTPITKIKGVVNKDGWRRMTPREWARLQGFPENYIIPVSDAQAYKQFGNSVAIPAIQATAKVLIEKIKQKNA